MHSMNALSQYGSRSLEMVARDGETNVTVQAKTPGKKCPYCWDSINCGDALRRMSYLGGDADVHEPCYQEQNAFPKSRDRGISDSFFTLPNLARAAALVALASPLALFSYHAVKCMRAAGHITKLGYSTSLIEPVPHAKSCNKYVPSLDDFYARCERTSAIDRNNERRIVFGDKVLVLTGGTAEDERELVRRLTAIDTNGDKVLSLDELDRFSR